jgi:hypothetical protein
MAWSLSETDRSVVLGDLCEEFTTRTEQDGVRLARRWYRRQVLHSLFDNLAGRWIARSDRGVRSSASCSAG